MSADEFWHGEPQLAASYREAEKLKRENRYLGEWRAGYYVYMAVGACLTKEAEYPSEPIFSTALDDAEEKEKRERVAMERQVAQFGALASTINEKFAVTDG